MKKKTFILLEVLIAFTLVLISIIPLVEQPLKMFRKEMKSLEKMELERLADWTFTEVKEILLKQEIPFEKIPTKGAKSDKFPLPPASIEIPGNRPKKITRTFTLTGRGEKPGTGNNLYRQIGIYIHLDKNTYTFRLPVEKINS